mgnify:FL=1
MLNNLTPILFISGSISLLSFIPIHTTVKKLVTCFCETVWLIDTMSLGLSILAIYLIFYFTRSILVFFAKSIKSTWNEIKDYYVKIYMDVYYPAPEYILPVIEHKNLIFYSQAIELIKQSIYGIQKKQEAVKNGFLKETGGKYITETSFIGLLRSNESKKYIPSSEEKLESAKEIMLYDQIFQEFISGFGYYELDNQLKYDITYNKTFIKIEHSKLEEFLRIKELELQQKLLISNHEHIA